MLALVIGAGIQPRPLPASSRLLFLEAQGVAGYSTFDRALIFYSHDSMEAMQKPSLGFDLIQRFSGRRGDFALLAVQARLAINTGDQRTLEPQLYNAFLKLKMRPFDVWIGHNRPSFGLASYLDSHALLLQPLAMQGFGFDRDWGIGIGRDFAWGGGGLAVTAGSGMALRWRGNYFISGRLSRGVLNRDNYSLGFSFGFGKVLEVMGLNLMSEDPQSFVMAAIDLAWLRDSLENRLEIMAGARADQPAWAILWRIGLNLVGEGRLKLEAQPCLFRTLGATRFQAGLGVGYLISADLTLRMMAVHDRPANETRIICQLYFNKRLGI